LLDSRRRNRDRGQSQEGQDEETDLRYQGLPKDEQAIVLNERKASDKPTLVEGQLDQVGDSEFAIQATKVVIKGMQSRGKS